MEKWLEWFVVVVAETRKRTEVKQKVRGKVVPVKMSGPQKLLKSHVEVSSPKGDL